jgi:carbon-monoxide dehydrogenase small subunit
MAKEITLTVNGDVARLAVKPWDTLLEVLREKLGLTGTKEGCGKGDCGACTVLLDGKAVNSCLVLAVSCDGRSVTTIEGLATNRALHPVQKAFIENGAIQCGYCTPGMILSSVAFLEKNPAPTLEEIAMGLKGNICRCTGYTKIVKAVHAASREMGGRGREG